MSKEVLLVVETVSNEKGVSQPIIFEAIELALASATKKRYKEDLEVRVDIDQKSGEYETFRTWEVLEDETEIEFPDKQLSLAEAKTIDPNAEINNIVQKKIDNMAFGRIAAQTAKQVIVQKVREAERAQIISQYEKRVNELVTGTVKRVTRDNAIIDLGSNAEAILMRDDMIPKEIFRVNERIRAVIKEIRADHRGPQIILSRTIPQMLVALFKIEVPEISEEVIEVRGAARDPGNRAKICVKTNDGRIDPIGACVGMRGSRVQAVSGELENERIDIILWDDNPAQLVINAMEPAEVVSIVVDEETHSMDIAVKEENLSQAIGRSGQNVRLASELTGWTINVMTEEHAEQKHQEETSKIVQMFQEQLNVDEELATLLYAEGFTTVEEIAYVPLEELLAIEGLDKDIVDELRNCARDFMLTQALSSEESTSEPAEDLLELEGMNKETAFRLANQGIITREDLAELAVDDLLDFINDIDEKHAADLIMTARKPWFEEESSNS